MIVIAACVLLTSCGSSKNLTKSKSESDSSFVDRSKIKTVKTSEADTVVIVSQDSLKGSVEPEDTTETIVESGTIEVKFTPNKKTKKIDFKVVSKPDPIRLKVNTREEKIQDNNIAVAVHEEQKGKELHKESWSLIPWYLWPFIILILIIILIWINRKRIAGWILTLIT